MITSVKGSFLLKKKLFLVFFYFFLSLIQVFSFGNQEDDFDRAKRLFEERNIREALILLTEIAREDPEKFDEAQALIEEIHKIKKEINEKQEEVKRKLYEEEDEGEALRILEEIKELDKSQNPDIQRIWRQVEEGAKFVYNRKTFTSIMDSALDHLNNARHTDALTEYLKGFTLYRDEFYEGVYSDSLKNAASERVNEVELSINVISENMELYRDLFVSADLLLDSKRDIQKEYFPVLEVLKELADLRRQMFNIARALKEYNELAARMREDGRQDYFLAYSERTLTGRTELDDFEGIIYTVESLYTESLKTLTDKALIRAQETFNKGILAYKSGDMAFAREEFIRAEGQWSVASETVLMWKHLIYLEEGYTPENPSLADTVLKQILDVFTAGEMSQAYVDLIALEEKLPAYTRFTDRQNALELREEVLNDLQKTQELITFSRDKSQETERGPEYYTKTPLTLRDFSTAAEKLRETLVRREIDSVYFVALDDAGFLDSGRSLNDEKFTQASDYLEGVIRVVTDGDITTELTSFYPDLALELLNELKQYYTEETPLVEEYLVYYRGEKKHIVEDDRVSFLLSENQNLKEKMDRDLEAVLRLITEAEERSFLAQKLRNEGDFRVDLVRTNIRDLNFPRARENLALAQNKYNESVSYNENLEFREEFYNLLLTLDGEIRDAENAVVVRDVRTYLTESREFYLKGNYLRAEDLLYRAERRWADTNPDENVEIKYWLNLVKAALSVESGRDLKTTEPLYNEIAQYLNLANLFYEQGRDFLQERKKVDALRMFLQAEESLNNVLISRPLNQKARVLALKILKERDPDEFPKTFRENYERSVAKLSSDIQSAYLELKDLYIINPGFPGLAQTIYRAEITLGIRVPPPDQKAIRESNKLYNEAMELAQSDNSATLEIALIRLNKAIEINPDNQKAIAAKDEVQLKIGGTASFVLTAASEQQYRNAEKKYIEGKYYEALQIVEVLLKNPKNRKYPPLMELKRRIESKIL